MLFPPNPVESPDVLPPPILVSSIAALLFEGGAEKLEVSLLNSPESGFELESELIFALSLPLPKVKGFSTRNSLGPFNF